MNWKANCWLSRRSWVPVSEACSQDSHWSVRFLKYKLLVIRTKVWDDTSQPGCSNRKMDIINIIWSLADDSISAVVVCLNDIWQGAGRFCNFIMDHRHSKKEVKLHYHILALSFLRVLGIILAVLNLCLFEFSFKMISFLFWKCASPPKSIALVPKMISRFWLFLFILSSLINECHGPSVNCNFTIYLCWCFLLRV